MGRRYFSAQRISQLAKPDVAPSPNVA